MGDITWIAYVYITCIYLFKYIIFVYLCSDGCVFVHVWLIFTQSWILLWSKRTMISWCQVWWICLVKRKFSSHSIFFLEWNNNGATCGKALSSSIDFQVFLSAKQFSFFNYNIQIVMFSNNNFISNC